MEGNNAMKHGELPVRMPVKKIGRGPIPLSSAVLILRKLLTKNREDSRSFLFESSTLSRLNILIALLIKLHKYRTLRTGRSRLHPPSISRRNERIAQFLPRLDRLAFVLWDIRKPCLAVSGHVVFREHLAFHFADGSGFRELSIPEVRSHSTCSTSRRSRQRTMLGVNENLVRLVHVQ